MRNIYVGKHLTKLLCYHFQLIWSIIHDDICIKTISLQKPESELLTPGEEPVAGGTC